MKQQAQLLIIIDYILLISFSQASNSDPDSIGDDCDDHHSSNCGGQRCTKNSECLYDCCHNHYCTIDAMCDEDTRNIVVIFVPIVVGIFIIIAIYCFCRWRKRRNAEFKEFQQNADLRHQQFTQQPMNGRMISF